MPSRLTLMCCFLLGSGACSLIYQVVWLRALRLVFGASTPASSAVLGIFMAGLGLGGLYFGPRADKHPRPLRLYGALELGIALSAGLSLVLLELVRSIYLSLGGAAALGLTGASLLRIGLAALVLAPPTLLMGGTLPAAARAVTQDHDPGRGALAALYGVNTIGAVLGVLLANFWLLEHLGANTSLILAAGFNALLAILALRLPKRFGAPTAPNLRGAADGLTPELAALTSPRFVFLAAFVAGFAFLLMELVWYRMLGPILGGSTYTFGLILALALTGIGLGGAVYSWLQGPRPVSLSGFALVCGAEALAMGLPLYFGEDLALLAHSLRGFGIWGFKGMILSWTIITAIVVFPAALISGYQFPFLVALLGRGGEQLGEQLGRTYAWNTLGAILGSLLGGFVLLPWLGAVGLWRAVTLSLLALSLIAWAIALRSHTNRSSRLIAIPLSLASLATVFATGPAAIWRHSGIGVGRSGLTSSDPAELERWRRESERGLVWEAEGLEMSVALRSNQGLSFVVNGKVDGNARADAPTQVVAGILGALLHPAPKTAMVIGLGTGSTAGWLAQVPSMSRVDCVELEPVILEVARRCAPVNEDALENKKLRIIINDAREELLVTSERYDVIFSEPSNPYRAGIASLYTAEFYAAVKQRLSPGGLLVQWLQAYEIDQQTFRTVAMTLQQVFPAVEVWQSMNRDLLFVASEQPQHYDAAAFRQRVAAEPFARALSQAWATDSLEGVLARFVSKDLRKILALGPQLGQVNTDDRNFVEYGFARTLGRQGLLRVDELIEAGQQSETARPRGLEAGVDGSRVLEERALQLALCYEERVPLGLPVDSKTAARIQAYHAVLRGAWTEARQSWRSQDQAPRGPAARSLIGLAFSEDGRSAELATLLQEHEPGFKAEARIFQARAAFANGQPGEAAARLTEAFAELSRSPWSTRIVVDSGLNLATRIGLADREAGATLFKALSRPFAVLLADGARLRARLSLAMILGPEPFREALQVFEPRVPWEREVLLHRMISYQALNDPRASAAAEDLERYLKMDSRGYSAWISPPLWSGQ